MALAEEELKHQRELMRQGFEQVDKRFEQVEKRLEQIDKRFEQVDNCFEQVDQRLNEMLKRHDRQFLWVIGFIATTSAGLIISAAQLL